LARKIAVIAWALLRDEKDWEPKRMIEVTESFGKMPGKLKETLETMKPKENSDQRRSRLRREAREARAAALDNVSTSPATLKCQAKSQTKQPHAVPSKHQTRATTGTPQSTPSKPKPRRARKPVSAS
jgi:hypothetical protein